MRAEAQSRSGQCGPAQPRAPAKLSHLDGCETTSRLLSSIVGLGTAVSSFLYALKVYAEIARRASRQLRCSLARCAAGETRAHCAYLLLVACLPLRYGPGSLRSPCRGRSTMRVATSSIRSWSCVTAHRALVSLQAHVQRIDRFESSGWWARRRSKCWAWVRISLAEREPRLFAAGERFRGFEPSSPGCKASAPGFRECLQRALRDSTGAASRQP